MSEYDTKLMRCCKTGNPVGTDTWPVTGGCECPPCRAFARRTAEADLEAIKQRALAKLTPEERDALLTPRMDGL